MQQTHAFKVTGVDYTGALYALELKQTSTYVYLRNNQGYSS